MNLSHDIASMIRLSAPFAGNLPTAVILPSGRTVEAVVGVASEDDILVHGATITSSTRKLTFVAAQTPGLRTQQNVIWNGAKWGVLTMDSDANGAATVVFIGSPF